LVFAQQALTVERSLRKFDSLSRSRIGRIARGSLRFLGITA